MAKRTAREATPGTPGTAATPGTAGTPATPGTPGTPATPGTDTSINSSQEIMSVGQPATVATTPATAASRTTSSTTAAASTTSPTATTAAATRTPGDIPLGADGEAQALANILEGTALGGSINLPEGTDVAQYLKDNPALAQLIQESIYAQTGQTTQAIDSSKKYNTVKAAQDDSGITTSDPVSAAEKEAADRIAAAESASGQDLGWSEPGGPVKEGIKEDVDFLDPSMSESDAQKAIADRRKQLDEEYNADVERIQEMYAGYRESQEAQNKELLGGTKSLTAIAGAYGSMSGRSGIQKQSDANQAAINKLLSDEQNAIAMAKSARNSEDFELLYKSIETAEAARKEINTLRQQSFDNSITSQTLMETQKNNDRVSAQAAFENLEKLSAEQLESFDDSVFAELEADLQLPEGYFKQLNLAKAATEKATSEAATFESRKELLELALKVPVGSSFMLDENTTVTGLSTTGNKVMSFSDNSGNVTFVTLDANGNPINQSSIAGIDGSKTSGGAAGGGGGSGLSPELYAMATGLLATEGIPDEKTGKRATRQDTINSLLLDPLSALPGQAEAITDFFQDYNKTVNTTVVKTKDANQVEGYVMLDSDSGVPTTEWVPFIQPEAEAEKDPWTWSKLLPW